MKGFTKGLLLTFHGVGDTVVDPSVLVKGKHWGRGLLWPIDPASVLKRDNPLIKLISYQIASSGSTTLYAVVFCTLNMQYDIFFSRHMLDGNWNLRRHLLQQIIILDLRV